MKIKRTSQPDSEPVTLSEAKQHLRVVNSDEDDYIQSLIQTAREDCEKYQNRSYYTQTWKLVFDELQNDIIELPRPPVQSIDSIVVIDSDGTSNDVTDYDTDFISEPARLKINNYPNVELAELNALQITYIAGYSNVSDIPQNVKHAMKLAIGHWYNERETSVVGTSAQELPYGVKHLLDKDRVVPV